MNIYSQRRGKKKNKKFGKKGEKLHNSIPPTGEGKGKEKQTEERTLSFRFPNGGKGRGSPFEGRGVGYETRCRFFFNNRWAVPASGKKKGRSSEEGKGGKKHRFFLNST